MSLLNEKFFSDKPQQLIFEFYRLFVQNTPDNLIKIEKYIHNDCFYEAYKVAHSIKPSIQMILIPMCSNKFELLVTNLKENDIQLKNTYLDLLELNKIFLKDSIKEIEQKIETT